MLERVKIRGPSPDGIQLRAWQLFFADMTGGRVRRAPSSGLLPASEEAPLPVTWQLPGQLALFPARPDVLRFARARHATPHNPALIEARVVAQRDAETFGWSRWLVEEVDEALEMVLSAHAPGDRVRYSDLVLVDQRGANVGHTGNVLAQIGVLLDDRPDTFQAWLNTKLAPMAPGIAADVQAWSERMRTGGKRGLPRAEQTIRNYLNVAYPYLVGWSQRCQHLREVTRDDIHAVADQQTGLRRKRVLVALRSIFRFCKQVGRVFTDPTTHIRPAGNHTPILQPIQAEVLQRVVDHAATPASRLILALAAVHAARPTTIRQLQLDQLELANQRLTIAGHTRRLDSLTARLAREYLSSRQRQWPHTSNTHLFVTERTAHGDQAVSEYWLHSHFKTTGLTLNQIRMDRQLEEALTHGPDPLHLTAVFGISQRAAIGYATVARQLLHTEIDETQ